MEMQGLQVKDKMKIMNNGKIERTKDNNPYDTITNKYESKSIQIACTNVTKES
ncbi:Uncharacterised protein [Chryseobacterium indologenes]|nr:Uncharacterised protein [Chryseobacterium indologenes]